MEERRGRGSYRFDRCAGHRIYCQLRALNRNNRNTIRRYVARGAHFHIMLLRTMRAFRMTVRRLRVANLRQAVCETLCVPNRQ